MDEICTSVAIIFDMVVFRAKIGEKEYNLECSSDSKIGEAKLQLEQSSGLQSSQQKWIYQGRILGDDATIGSAAILDGHAVHVLKVAGSNPASNPTPAAAAAPLYGSQGPPVIATEAPSRFLLKSFDMAMQTLLSNSEDVVSGAVSLLAKITGNIVHHPMEEKYRKLKSSNATFASKVHTVKGGPDCMRALGFAEEGGEWVLHPSAQGWDLLVACKKKLDIFNEKLTKATSDRSSGVLPAAVALSASPTSPPIDANTLLAMQEFLKSLAAVQPPQPGGRGDGGSGAP